MRWNGLQASGTTGIHAAPDSGVATRDMLDASVTGWYAAGLIGLNQGLTKAREEVVGTMNTVRCNHWLQYMSWAQGSYERWKSDYPIYQGDSFVPALCSVSTEQQSIQSNRAAEQSAAEQPAGHMTLALLSRASSPTAGGDSCARSAAVRLGVITKLTRKFEYRL